MTTSLGPGTAPPETLAALREIDPDADLLHLGGDEWLLGVRRENPAAKARLTDELAELDPMKGLSHEIGKEFQLLQTCASGFRPIHLYAIGWHDELQEEITFGWIVEDFRRRDHNWRTRPDAAFAEMKQNVSLEERGRWRSDLLRDYAESEGPSLWRHIFRRARSFLQGTSLPGGTE